MARLWLEEPFSRREKTCPRTRRRQILHKFTAEGLDLIIEMNGDIRRYDTYAVEAVHVTSCALRRLRRLRRLRLSCRVVVSCRVVFGYRRLPVRLRHEQLDVNLLQFSVTYSVCMYVCGYRALISSR